MCMTRPLRALHGARESRYRTVHGQVAQDCKAPGNSGNGELMFGDGATVFGLVTK